MLDLLFYNVQKTHIINKYISSGNKTYIFFKSAANDLHRWFFKLVFLKIETL